MVTRERLLETLNGPWAHYVAAYDALSSDVQKEYLRRQGYRRFADVLAHIRAWWLRGRTIVESLVADPATPATEIDVDAFNAAAVADVQAQAEPEVRSAFEQARRDMIDLLERLPPEAFSSERIVGQLNMEIIGHAAEHSLAEY